MNLHQDIPEQTYFYRYDEVVCETYVQLLLRKFTVLRETPKGHWVIESYNPYCPEMNELYKKWVSKTSIKRFCYPTTEQAFIAFHKRKERQLSILQSKIKIVKIAIKLTEAEQLINHDLLY